MTEADEFEQAERAARMRQKGRCEACGRQGSQGWLWRPPVAAHRMSWFCRPCHDRAERAHLHRRRRLDGQARTVQGDDSVN